MYFLYLKYVQKLRYILMSHGMIYIADSWSLKIYEWIYIFIR